MVQKREGPGTAKKAQKRPKQRGLAKKARVGAEALVKALNRTALDGLLDDPDAQAVIAVLNQAPQVVRAVRDRYDEYHSSWSSDGLLGDLTEKFSGEELALMVGLLAQAGLADADRNHSYRTQDDSRDGPRIVPEPLRPVVAPGTAVRYTIDHGDQLRAPDSRRAYQWYCLNDPAAVARGKLARVEGPDTGYWDATWDFEGEHTVVCRIQEGQPGAALGAPLFVEYKQVVRGMRDIARDQFERTAATDFVDFRIGLEMHDLTLSRNGIPDQDFGEGVSDTAIENSGPNPAVPGRAPDLAYHTYTVRPHPGATRLHWYALWEDKKRMPKRDYFGYRRVVIDGQDAFELGSATTARWIIADRNVYTIVCDQYDDAGTLLATATYRQVVQSAERVRQVAGWRKYMSTVDSRMKGMDPDRRVALRTSYVNQETGATFAPDLFLGLDKGGDGHVRLLDLTPGIGRIDYGGRNVASALVDFATGNAYPTGMLMLEIPDNDAGFERVSLTFETDGSSDWASWAADLGWASLGLAALGVAASVIPGTQAAAPALFVMAAGTGAASSGLSIYDQLHQAEVSGVTIAIDILGIASSIIGGAGALRAACQGPAVILGNRTGRFFLVSGLAADVGAGLLLTVQASEQILAILDGDRPESEKISTVVRILANLALTGGLIALSVRDARASRSQRQPGVPAPEPTGTDAIGAVRGTDVYPPNTYTTNKGAARVSPLNPEKLKKGIDRLQRGSHLHGALVARTSGSTFTVKIQAPNGATIPIQVEVQVKNGAEMRASEVHRTKRGSEAGPARLALVQRDGDWHATIELDSSVHPDDVRHILGHEVNEMADLVARYPGGVPNGGFGAEMEASLFIQDGSQNVVTAHDRAAVLELVGLFQELRNATTEAKRTYRGASFRRALRWMGLDDTANISAKLQVVGDLCQKTGVKPAIANELIHEIQLTVARKTLDTHVKRPGGSGTTIFDPDVVRHVMFPEEQGRFVSNGIYGGHETKSLLDFVREHDRYALSERARKTVGGTVFRRYRQYRWKGTGKRPSPDDVDYVDGPSFNPADWDVSARPKTTADDMLVFLSQADDAWRSWLAAHDGGPGAVDAIAKSGRQFGGVGTVPPAISSAGVPFAGFYNFTPPETWTLTSIFIEASWLP